MSHKCFKSDIRLYCTRFMIVALVFLSICVCVTTCNLFLQFPPGPRPITTLRIYFCLFLFAIYTIVCTANAHEWLTIGQLQFRVIVHWLTISIEHCPPIIIYNHFYHCPAIQRSSNSYTGFIDSIDI